MFDMKDIMTSENKWPLLVSLTPGITFWAIYLTRAIYEIPKDALNIIAVPITGLLGVLYLFLGLMTFTATNNMKLRMKWIILSVINGGLLLTVIFFIPLFCKN